MELLYQDEACAITETNDHGDRISDRSDGHSGRESQSRFSGTTLHGRSGFVLPSASIASVVAVLPPIVSICSGSENQVDVSFVDLRTHQQKNDSSLSPEIARSEQSDKLNMEFLPGSSQIVESERGFARSVAVAWEQQTGAMFEVASHVGDLRFSECCLFHRRLSSAWHHEWTFPPAISICLNCHRMGG
ncbi:MAG: hypothetical protein ACK58L_16735 [Planctomycetota bacterium]